ncbi:hypothetical protein QEW_0965 [Clostridioides difficile CD160]|nr:hypothetical protein QEW_0965 [Clostridioides difficile CD160]
MENRTTINVPLSNIKIPLIFDDIYKNIKMPLTFDDIYKNIKIPLTFDNIYNKRMQSLIIFMKKVGYEASKYRISPYGDELISKPEYSFLGTSMAVASQFFYFLMKDQLSECTNNFALDFLCKYISTDKEDKTINENVFLENQNYMINLTKERFNEMLTCQTYDFYVSMWSCFETAITSMTVTHEKKIIEKLSNSRFKKIKKFCKNNISDKMNNCCDNLEDLKDKFDKEFPIFISFPDRTNYLLDEISEDYTRSEKKDKEILLFLVALRNTVHNNGVHLKANKNLELAGHLFKIEQNKKFHYESSNDIMILINEIFDIYLEILKCYTKKHI